jgi:predicted transcriptional regulator of viral defense system
MSTLLKPIWVQQQLIEHNLRIFTPLTFSRLFKTNPTTTKYFLETHTLSGLFLRLKNGLYMLKTSRARLEEISNILYSPSYLSLEFALSHYNLIPETVYSITAITTKPTREFEVGGIAFTYHTIKKSAFTGYSLVDKDNQPYLMADPEKALVDYLYFVILENKVLNDRINIIYSKLDHDKAAHYASLFSLPKLDTLVKIVLSGSTNHDLIY